MSTIEDGSVEIDVGSWRQTASRIADELQHDRRSERMAKVSSLLHTFRSQGGHCDIQEMVAALRDQGVTVRAAASGISRRDVLDLCLDGGTGRRDDASSGGIRVSRWHAGAVGRMEPLGEGLDAGGGGEVLWFDVDPRGDDPSADDVHDVTRRLQPRCPELTETIVRDLLTPDQQPKSETYGDERTGVRKVSVPALVTREVLDEDDDFDGFDEQLIIQVVELVVGRDWMVTCWHSTRTLVGGGKVEMASPLLREPFTSHVAHRWVTDPGDNPDRRRGQATSRSTSRAPSSRRTAPRCGCCSGGCRSGR